MPVRLSCSRFVAIGLIVLACTVSDALAQGRGRRGRKPADESPAAPAAAARPRPATADTIGLEFREQLVIDAIPLVESDKGDEAVKNLTTARADTTIKDEERKRELRAGLGLVYARIGDFANARQNVHDMGNLSDGTNLGPRCRAIELAIDEATKKGPEFKSKIKDHDAWFDLLRAVRRASETRFRQYHADASRAISDHKWTSVVAPARKAYLEAAVINVIWPKDPDALDDALAEHVRQASAEIKALDAAAHQLHAEGEGLLARINQMRRHKDPGRFSLIDNYDRDRNDITSARAAADALTNEFRAEQGTNPALHGQLPVFVTPDLAPIDKN